MAYQEAADLAGWKRKACCGSCRTRSSQLGLTLYRTQHTIDWGALMAATTIATVPTVAIFLGAQQYFVQGIALTGIKG